MAKTLIDLFNIAGKRVVIIGGSGILGSAIARGFHQSGARVAITSTTLEKAQRVAHELSSEEGPIIGLQVDACDRTSLTELAEALKFAWGGVDVLINAAGGNKPAATIAPDKEFFDMDISAFEDVLKLNLMAGAVLPVLVFGAMMKNQKTPVSIINISSMAASRALSRVVAYAAAKAALENFTRWIACECCSKYGRQFRVNAIAPGFFLTEQNRFLLTDEKTGELTARGKKIIGQTPMAEFGKPEELAGACLWLASDAASFVTGAVIPVDGGFSAFSGV
jgi:NAD(P)-dependent dehydrogenase (short-subunit alcohol dehydrogenase family)